MSYSNRHVASGYRPNSCRLRHLNNEFQCNISKLLNLPSWRPCHACGAPEPGSVVVPCSGEGLGSSGFGSGAASHRDPPPPRSVSSDFWLTKTTVANTRRSASEQLFLTRLYYYLELVGRYGGASFKFLLSDSQPLTARPHGRPHIDMTVNPRNLRQGQSAPSFTVGAATGGRVKLRAAQTHNTHKTHPARQAITHSGRRYGRPTARLRHAST
jgi:hypothetical protein